MLTQSRTRTPTGIACWTVGNGPPLICVPGGPGIDHAFFRPVLDALATRRTVVYFDLPGHGHSTAPPSYDPATMARAIDDVRAHLGADQVSLLGSSYGGYLSLLYARDMPERVRSMVLVGTAAAHSLRRETIRIAREYGTPEMLSAIGRLITCSIATDEEFRDALRTIAPLYFHSLPDHEARAIADSGTYRLDALKKVIATINDFNIRDDLPGITTLSLVMAGRHDWITGVANAQELASCLPVSDFIIYEESGHYPFLDEPERFIPTVDEWLRAHGA